MEMFLSAPKGLRDQGAVEQRVAMWTTSDRVSRLRGWLEQYQHRTGLIVPLPDPADGGDTARVLVLLEAPGPATNPELDRPGSGFISIDNNDGTAANLWELRREVGLWSGSALHWNIVPHYLGPASVKPNAKQVADGAGALQEVIGCLPRLEAVVLCGRYAQRGWSRHLRAFSHLEVLETWHPSPLAMTRPERRTHLRQTLARAAARLT